jgi:phage gp45-like
MSIGSSLWGIITGADAGKAVPYQQGESLDRIGDMTIVTPYGFYSHAPNGQLFKVVDGDGKAVIAVNVERPDGVEQGEVTMHHPASGAVIILKNNGDINVTTEADVNVSCNNANVTAQASSNLTCVSATVTASTSMLIDTPLATFTTNVLINGTLTAVGLATLGSISTAGATSLGSTVTSGTKNISDTHTHGDPPTTDVPSP